MRNHAINLAAAVFLVLGVLKIDLCADTDSTKETLPNWFTFGTDGEGSNVYEKDKEIQAETDWSATSWGFGLSYTLPIYEDSRELKSIRVEIKSSNQNLTKVHAGLATKATGSMAQDSVLASTITDEWQNLEFRVQEMALDFSGIFPSKFDNRGYENLEMLNLFFAKPKNVKTSSDTIYVRNLVLVFFEDESYAKK